MTKSLVLLAVFGLSSSLLSDQPTQKGVPILSTELAAIFVHMENDPVAVPVPIKTGINYFSIMLPDDEMRFYVHLPEPDWNEIRRQLPKHAWIATHGGSLHWTDDASRLMGVSVGLELMVYRGNRALAKANLSLEKTELTSRVRALAFAARVVKRTLLEKTPVGRGSTHL